MMKRSLATEETSGQHFLRTKNLSLLNDGTTALAVMAECMMLAPGVRSFAGLKVQDDRREGEGREEHRGERAERPAHEDAVDFIRKS